VISRSAARNCIAEASANNPAKAVDFQTCIVYDFSWFLWDCCAAFDAAAQKWYLKYLLSHVRVRLSIRTHSGMESNATFSTLRLCFSHADPHRAKSPRPDHGPRGGAGVRSVVGAFAESGANPGGPWLSSNRPRAFGWPSPGSTPGAYSSGRCCGDHRTGFPACPVHLFERR